ncbi:MAG: hypothetical protein HQK51_08315 [Oligoflexia bacterium]|nr:hypothetical protein [Oligoflexia bacterium]
MKKIILIVFLFMTTMNASIQAQSEFRVIPLENNHPFFQGVLKVDVTIPGGETNGYAIITKDNERYELILPANLKGKIDHLDGLYVEVQGEVVDIQGVDTEIRKAIKVDYFSFLE